MSRNTFVAVAAVVLAGGIVIARSRRSGRSSSEVGDKDLRHLQKRKPTGGRRTRRADPYADGHATPAGGDTRPKGAPAYFKA
ncbi:hypothetical protein [Acidipropionibacterium acidipropionici]|uniref:hypothetical protein n=1 Tax=Acidipropionibacterium acidipropionici TaxID=1748 RepID=UPI0004920DEB|nr:hypothetical protein [Acidipropionibacterium acidipropionici]APZ09946.1 hypothetical protein BWX38_12600 [Acidipropionibacterium acidipropionici]